MSLFDTVNQYAQMRQQLEPAFAAPQKPEQPDLSTLGSAGVSPNGVPIQLVPYGGKQINSTLLPYVNQLAQRFPGLRFNSGYRDPSHNAAVNGVPNSWHLQGRATDWSGSAKDMQAAEAWARQNGAREALIHNAGSGQHLHLAW